MKVYNNGALVYDSEIRVVPKDAEVRRANGAVLCPICQADYYSHIFYQYPSGMGGAVKSCELDRDGNPLFLHL